MQEWVIKKRLELKYQLFIYTTINIKKPLKVKTNPKFLFSFSYQSKKTKAKERQNKIKPCLASGYMSSPDFPNPAVLLSGTIDPYCTYDYDSLHWEDHADQQGWSSKHIFAWMSLLTSKANQLEKSSLTLHLEKKALQFISVIVLVLNTITLH